jgi:DNA/RNA-binding domain of Phe-tRNA-synthetase-like protein
MEPLTFSVQDRVLDQVPSYVLGLIAVPDIAVAPTSPAISDLLTEAEDRLHKLELGKAEVSALPPIAAWREAYRTVGANPSKFPCAAESVLRRVAKAGRLPRINSVVDLCNAVSLDSRLPVASCDVGTVGAELAVRLAEGGEVYLPLGAPDAPEQPEPGEVIYADGLGRAHSRRWNWRQSDVFKTDPGRRRLLITVEAVHEDGRADVETALARLADLLDGFTDSRQAPVVLDRDRRSTALFA